MLLSLILLPSHQRTSVIFGYSLTLNKSIQARKMKFSTDTKEDLGI